MRSFVSVILIILFALALILQVGSPLAPEFIEKYYANGIDLMFRQVQGFIFNVFPFSMGEALTLSGTVFLFFWVLYLVLRLVRWKRDSLKTTLRLFGITLLTLGTLYTCFVFFWGLNYQRPSILPTENVVQNVDRLEKLCRLLIEDANRQRSQLSTESLYRKLDSEAWKNLQTDLDALYSQMALEYPTLRGRFSLPKPIYFSVPFSYTGIVGIYFPFTGEANINTNQVPFDLAATAAHEMAHQRGYAREEDANFISYLVTQHSDNPAYQYSGTLLALIHASNRLYEDAPERYLALRELFSPELSGDLKYSRDYWKPYRGEVEKKATELNDSYLKSNGESEGVVSYSLMIKLLLEYYKDSL